jgi:hypothetical protein
MPRSRRRSSRHGQQGGLLVLGPGLYGIGNCVASASRRAYWAGGATIGPMIAFAYRAAQAADRELIKQTATQGVQA